MSTITRSGVALLVGAGDAIGAAVARRFAAGGYSVCIARRDAEKSRSVVQEIVASGGLARAIGTDVRNEEAVQALFAQAEAELGPVEVCLFNAGANVKTPLIETSCRLFFKAWELACFGGFLTGREAARYMVPRGHGTILFTGATASIRGGSGFAAFAAAKFGLRAVAQSMARELAPKNIHVAHLIIDGVGGQRGDPQAALRRHRNNARPCAGQPDPDQLGCRGLLGIAQPVARRMDARACAPSRGCCAARR